MVSEKSGAFQPPPVKRLFESESEVTQSYLTLCDPMDCSLPGFSVRGIFQLRVLEWVAISFSRASSQPRDQTMVSHIASRCFTLWATRAAQCLFGRPNIDLEEVSQVAQWERIILPMQRHSRLRFDPWVRKILWKRKWQLTPVLLPGESHGQRATVHGAAKSRTWPSTHTQHTQSHLLSAVLRDNCSWVNTFKYLPWTMKI